MWNSPPNLPLWVHVLLIIQNYSHSSKVNLEHWMALIFPACPPSGPIPLSQLQRRVSQNVLAATIFNMHFCYILSDGRKCLRWGCLSWCISSLLGDPRWQVLPKDAANPMWCTPVPFHGLYHPEIGKVVVWGMSWSWLPPISWSWALGQAPEL